LAEEDDVEQLLLVRQVLLQLHADGRPPEEVRPGQPEQPVPGQRPLLRLAGRLAHPSPSRGILPRGRPGREASRAGLAAGPLSRLTRSAAGAARRPGWAYGPGTIPGGRVRPGD